MKKLVLLAMTACALGSAMAETSVGVSIGVYQPGVYGRIDIGNAPQPRYYNPQPVLIAPPPVYVTQQPVYLYVPPGHQKHWERYCGRYHACGQPVYFVREDWVRERYDEHRRHGDDHDHGHDHGRGHDKHWKDRD